MNSPTNNRIFKNPYFQGLILLIFFYLLLPVRFTNNISCEVVESCIDTSWMMSLQWAIQKNLIFGKEYVFTYGPLGVLVTRSLLGISRFYLLLFDFFVTANLLFILHYAIKKFPNVLTVLFCLLLVLTTASGLMYGEGIGFILLLISVFWLNHALNHRRRWSLMIPSLITVLLFYFKVNVGLIGVAIFYGYWLYYFFIEKKNKFGKILIGLIIPCVILLLSFPLNTDLPGYIRAGLSFVDGYNDAMNIGIGEYRLCTIVAIAVVFGCLLLFFTKNFKKLIPLFLTYGIFSYVLFKQSFVRSDLHILTFFAIFPAFIGITVLFFEKHSLFLKTAVASVCLISYIIGISLHNYPNPLDKSVYLAGAFAAYNPEQVDKNAALFALPPEILDKIGGKSVDIVPWEIVFPYFNRLNYTPRPVVQSYAAYTPYLTDLNYEKYAGKTAPEFVIVSNKSIDNRYAFFDDQKVKLSLITDYYCNSTFKVQDNDYLLFQRKPKNAIIDVSPPSEDSVKIGEEYVLKDPNKSYFIRMDVEYSLLGKALRFAYKPFLIWINFKLEDGSIFRHRVIIPILKDGVTVNPYIENENDLYNFMTGEQSAQKKIKSFRFETTSSTAILNYVAVKSYDETIKLSISEISINRNSQQ